MLHFWGSQVEYNWLLYCHNIRCHRQQWTSKILILKSLSKQLRTEYRTNGRTSYHSPHDFHKHPNSWIDLEIVLCFWLLDLTIHISLFLPKFLLRTHQREPIDRLSHNLLLLLNSQRKIKRQKYWGILFSTKELSSIYNTLVDHIPWSPSVWRYIESRIPQAQTQLLRLQLHKNLESKLQPIDCLQSHWLYKGMPCTWCWFHSQYSNPSRTIPRHLKQGVESYRAIVLVWTISKLLRDSLFYGSLTIPASPWRSDLFLKILRYAQLPLVWGVPRWRRRRFQRKI